MGRTAKILTLILVMTMFVTAAAFANPFKGKGKKATRKFKLNPGIYVFNVEHKGFSKFNFSFKEANGRVVKLLAEGVGPYKGQAVVGIPKPVVKEGEKPPGPKTYFIDVVADGAWTVTITSTKKEDEGTMSFEGETKTKEVTGLFPLKKGTYDIITKHKGGREFAGVMYDQQGRKVLELGKGIGHVTEKKRIKVPEDNMFIIEIKASGPWTVNISEVLE